MIAQLFLVMKETTMSQTLQKTGKTINRIGIICGVLLTTTLVPPIMGNANAQVRPSAPIVNPPLPSEQQPPIATLRPSNGLVGVKLINKTGADIAYQVIGDTQVRTLSGRSTAMLQALKTPANVTFYRRDRGFLLVSPQVPTTAPNTIELTLTETTDFAIDKTALSIDPDGAVYLN